MQDLIRTVAERLNIDAATAQSAVAALLRLIQEHANSSDAATLINKLPGAEALLASTGTSSDNSSGGGMLGGLMGSISGALGDQAGGATAALGQLSAVGIEPNQISPLVEHFVGFAKDHAGDDLVERVIGSIPGLASLKQ